MAGELNWAKMLDALYRDNGFVQMSVTNGEMPEEYRAILDEEYDIYSLTDLGEEEAKEATEYLIDTGLIEINDDLTTFFDTEEGSGYITHCKLTEEGFSVAHERELARRQEKLNKSLVSFTFILLIINAIGLYPAQQVQAIGSFILLIGLGYLVVKEDIW